MRSRKVTVPPWVRSRPDCLASAPGARTSSRGRLRTQALPISRGCGNAPKNRQAEAHRTKKAITRSSSLRVIAVSACSGVLLLESTACRSPCEISRLTFSACSQRDGLGFRLKPGEFTLRSALSLRLRSLHAGVIAIDPGLRKEVLIAVAMEG